MVLETELERIRNELYKSRQTLAALLKENEDIDHQRSMVSLVYSIGSLDLSITQITLCLKQMEDEGRGYGKEESKSKTNKEN